MARVRLAALVALAVALSACSNDQDVFSPKGPNAEKINNLQVPVFLAAAVVGLIVAAMLGYVIVTGKRRYARTDDEEPAQIHGNTRLELGWTIVPFLILVAVAFPTVTTIIDISDRPSNPLTISVYGQQWWWSYEYDTNGDGTSDIITANELVIPVDTPVELKVYSRDVIHSFWIPDLGGARDAVPGREHLLLLEGSEVGEFEGQCKEFCGLAHANMRARAVVLSQEDFDQWLRDNEQDASSPASGTAEAAGLEAFKAKCASCHQIDGVNDAEGKAALVSGSAPNLTHFMSRKIFASGYYPLWVQTADGTLDFNRNQLEAWLRDPTRMVPMAPNEARGMPNLQLSDSEIDQLVAYLATLGPYPEGATPP